MLEFIKDNPVAATIVATILCSAVAAWILTQIKSWFGRERRSISFLTESEFVSAPEGSSSLLFTFRQQPVRDGFWEHVVHTRNDGNRALRGVVVNVATEGGVICDATIEGESGDELQVRVADDTNLRASTDLLEQREGFTIRFRCVDTHSRRLTIVCRQEGLKTSQSRLLIAPYPILDRNIARGNASPRKIVRAEPGGELAGRGD